MAKAKAKKRLSIRLSQVERHPRFPEIEEAIARGESAISIAKRFSTEDNPINNWAVHLHRRNLKKRAPDRLKHMRAESWRLKPEIVSQLRDETANGLLLRLREQFSVLLKLQD